MDDYRARHVGYGVIPVDETRCLGDSDGKRKWQVRTRFDIVRLYYYRDKASNSLPIIVSFWLWNKANFVKTMLENSEAYDAESAWVTE